MVTANAVVMEMAMTLGTILGAIGDHQQLPHSHRPINMSSPCARRMIVASLLLISMVPGSFLPGPLTRLPTDNEKRSGPQVLVRALLFMKYHLFLVAVMELQTLPHEQSGARMPMAFFKKNGHPIIDASTVQLLQTEYAMPVWKDLEDKEEREKWEKQWSPWVGVRLQVVDGRTLVGCLLVSIPKAINDQFFERTMCEDLDLFTLWKETFRYWRRFGTIYRTEPVWKGLPLEGSVSPMEWCIWFTTCLEKGSQVIGGVTKMQAGSQLLLVLTQYCEVREDMPWRRIGEKLFDDPAQRGFGYNYLELYVMVMEFLTQTEDARRAKGHFLGAAHSVSAVSGHCFTCGSPDHIKPDCLRNRRPEQAGQSDQKPVCPNCGKPGHFARDCREPQKLQCYHCGEPHRAAESPKPRSRSQSRDRPGSQTRDRSQQRGPSQKQEHQRSGFTPEQRPSVTSQHTVRSQRGNTPERTPSSASQRGRGPEHRTSSARRGSPSPRSSPKY